MLEFVKISMNLHISKGFPVLGAILKIKQIPIDILKSKINKIPAHHISVRTIIDAISRSLLR